MSRYKNLVCIPVINEKPNLEILLKKIFEIPFDGSVLIIDDGSTDGTSELISQYGKELDYQVQIHYDYSPNRRGIGNSHKIAMQFAEENGYRYLCTMDGDLTHDPSYLPQMIEILDRDPGIDLVIGSRFLDNSELSNWPVQRVALTNLGHILTRTFLGMKEDCSSGLRAYRVTTVPQKTIHGFHMSSYDFFFKSAFLYKKLNLKIREIPVTLYARDAGKSKMQVKDLIVGFLGVILFRVKAKKVAPQNQEIKS